MLMDTGKRKETVSCCCSCWPASAEMNHWERRNPVDPFMSNTGPPKPSKLFPKLKPRPFSYKILMSFRIGLGGPGLLSNSRIMSSAKAREATRSSLSVLSAFRNVLGKFCNATVND
ncbi:hypothetical protein Tsp_06658 [Trichinella spiralis]|uniref:hypothetical protein n=1 Tax=Trichinella spiralis TaxID=6334 RepID=UPI0001EFB532|nr:hypothetical protein Tsp_06658 [Trichinella spiralis]